MVNYHYIRGVHMGVHRNFQGAAGQHFAYISQVANADDQVRKQAGGPDSCLPSEIFKNLFSC